VQRTHDFERDGVDNGLAESLVGSMTLVDDVILTLSDHNVHLRRRHVAALQSVQPLSEWVSEWAELNVHPKHKTDGHFGDRRQSYNDDHIAFTDEKRLIDYRTDSTDYLTIERFCSAQQLDLFAWCVSNKQI